MTARHGTEDAAPRSAETVEHACGPLLERAQEALAFERGRADTAEAILAHVTDGLGQAVTAAVAAEQERIRKLAVRTGAVCTGDEGTSHYFADLLAPRESAEVPS